MTATDLRTDDDTSAKVRSRRARRGFAGRPKWLQRLVVWGGLLAAWQIFGMLAGPFFFASVTQTVGGFIDLAQQGDLTPIVKSFEQLFLGYALAVAIGIPAGIFIGSSLFGEATLGMARALPAT